GCGTANGRWRRDEEPCKEKQSTKSTTSAKDANSSSGGKGRDDGEASCSMVGMVEPSVLLAPEAGEEFQAVLALSSLGQSGLHGRVCGRCSQLSAMGNADLGEQVDILGRPTQGHCEATDDGKPVADFDWCGRQRTSSTWCGR
ncbi:unnamed protein product, partial [Closterium sp. NIES-53]